MSNGRIRKFGRGVALIAALGCCTASRVDAQDLDGTTTLLQPAGTLIMPFDQTANHASFQIVTRLGAGTGSGPIATHWSYWADDCRHLVDVFVCLTPADTKVMDPSHVQGEIQSPNPPTNNAMGSVTDLSGERGLVTVTAFEANTGPSGLECNVIDPDAVLPNELVGGWVIANTATNAAFGADAIGVAPDALPDPTLVVESGLFIQTFNPQSLGDSKVIVLSAETAAGNGSFLESEIGPIQRDRPDGDHVCCNVTFTDNLEISTSLPDLCLACVGFNPISDLQAVAGDVSIIPPNTTVESPGFIRLRNCETVTSDGTVDDLGADFEQFLFAVHGQAIGPFGAAIHGKYTGEPF
jgi:hypothetical protein